MLCSKCSNPVRPIVAVDIDGTLGDYHGHFLRFAAAYLDAPPQMDYRGEPRMREWFCERYETDERTWRDIKLAYRQGGMKRTMPAYPFATELCESIAASDAELWLTTTRPFLRLDGIDPDTRFWLERRDIRYDGLLYDEEKYVRLEERIDYARLVAVLDDELEQVESADDVFGPGTGVFRINKYNDAVIPEGGGVANLTEAATVIANRIKHWRSIHG